jgi:hypothetical protein
MLCKTCKENQVVIKKWGLCKKCYQRAYLKGELGFRRHNKLDMTEEKVKPEKPVGTAGIGRYSNHELDFIRNYFNHSDWLYESVIFRFSNFTYTPDFLDCHRNVFIEVVGSRQALHQNKHKHEAMRQVFYTIPFEVRLPNGELLDENFPNYQKNGAWPKFSVEKN